MALRIWLPLDGNIENKGLSGNVFGNIDAEINSEGKVGKCYSFNGSTSRIYTTGVNISNEAMTLCAWINRSSSGGEGYICSLNQGSGYADCQIGLDSYATSVVFVINGNSSISATITPNEWHHVAVTYDGTTMIGYVDGVQQASTTQTAKLSKTLFTVGARANHSQGGGQAITYPFPGKINDVRLYDECLSPKQIKELSKCLIAHYKLDGPGINTNLLIAGVQEKTISTPGTIDYDLNNDVRNLSAGENIIISFDAKAEVDNVHVIDVYFREINGNDQTFSMSPAFTIDGGYKRYIWETTYPDTSNVTGTLYLRFRGNLYVPGGGSNANGYSIRDIKIEKAPGDGKWIPHTSNKEYTNLGYNNTLGRDVSGYGHHLTIFGNFDNLKSEGRYNLCSSRRSGSGNFLSYHNFYVGSQSTMSAWVRPVDLGGSTQWVMYLGTNSGDASEIQHGWYLNNSGIVVDSGIQNKYNIVLDTNKWYHIATTTDGVTSKIYLNGNLVLTGSASLVQSPNLVLFERSANSAGTASSGYQYTGYLSDARVYATALSVEDIKELYQTAAKTDKNLYTYEFDCNLDNMIADANHAIAEQKWAGSIRDRYGQANCTATLTEDGYRIYRPANLAANNSQWGGIKICPNYNRDVLKKGHKYIMLYDVKGKTSNTPSYIGWSNNMGWGGGGLTPQPSNVSRTTIPADFNSDEWVTFWYKWDLNDDVRKVCTESYASFVEGETYLSYRDFYVGWGYTATGEMGTDLYFRNLRLYDITDVDQPKLIKTGIMNGGDINEIGDKTKIRLIGCESNNFIEM